LGLDILVGDVIMGEGFRAFLTEVTWPFAQTQQAILGSKFFFETWLLSENLEPLIDFLTYLEQKLWLKNQKLGKNPSPTKANLEHFD